MSAKQWAETCMMQDAYRTVEMWRNDGTSRRILHFAILASDLGIGYDLAVAILSTIENDN